jgi:hypothetical protein
LPFDLKLSKFTQVSVIEIHVGVLHSIIEVSELERNMVSMKISYTTKEESNKRREEEFLALTPTERFYRFLELMQASKELFPDKTDRSKNFQIVIHTDGK